MTMLTHDDGRFKPATYPSERREPARTTTIADLAMLKRFCLRAVGPLLATGAVAGIIGIKAAIFLSRINY